MAPNRVRGVGVADMAGTMDSSRGSASTAPVPRSTARRDRCLRVMKWLMSLPHLNSLPGSHARWWCRGRPLLKRRALYYAENQGAGTVVGAPGLAHDGAH